MSSFVCHGPWGGAADVGTFVAMKGASPESLSSGYTQERERAARPVKGLICVLPPSHVCLHCASLLCPLLLPPVFHHLKAFTIYCPASNPDSSRGCPQSPRAARSCEPALPHLCYAWNPEPAPAQALAPPADSAPCRRGASALLVLFTIHSACFSSQERITGPHSLGHCQVGPEYQGAAAGWYHFLSCLDSK